MINKLVKKVKGFTLVETLVAVLLLATAIAGPLTIASKSLIAAVVAKDQISAFFLAQDAVEYIRYVRDTNKLRGADWIAGTGGSSAGIDMSDCLNANGCYVDSTGQDVVSGSSIEACGSPCLLLRYGPVTNGVPAADARFRYLPTSANYPNTIFRRTIRLIDNGTEATVEVTVAWNTTSPVPRSITVRENIFDWQ